MIPLDFICHWIGHKWKGIITGFTGDGYPVGRCDRCDMPIVDDSQQATERLKDELHENR